ncbi:EH signature protein [Orenia metallireducens]|uniref:EH_Signature domain-containing protein n=1 Tax=Orenia metallireducens TaxID=1413210 RepID=A0A285I4L7_9FIRM|nr:EH signature domain-containing protein [Orenia metallireducens]PRX23239.1 EH signature protein [Orenia metallireducens]SNY42006.1 EH_Signature domain-containing protein [Orenia metallireducens]
MKKFVFKFTPQKLIDTAEDIKRRFPSTNQLAQERKNKYQQVDLEELLARIRKWKNSEVRSYAGQLKNREVYSLAYNFNQIPEELHEVVKSILVYRFKKSMVKVMWGNFCKNPDNRAITSFFNDTINRVKVIKFSNTPYSLLVRIFSTPDPIDWIIDYIIDLGFSYSKWIEYFQLTEKSQLVQSVIGRLFIKANRRIFEQEDNLLLLKLFSSLRTESFRKSAENYLEIFNVYEFDEELMELFKDRIGDPVENYLSSWNDMSEVARRKARQWFNNKEMKEFFASIDANEEEAQRRFEYWQNYNESIEKVKYIRYRLQLFLVFDKFVVIEFGEKGNAAYIYDKVYFNKHFANYMNDYNSVNNNRLKHKMEKFVGSEDNRIIHRDTTSGYWEQKADNKVKVLLR